MTKKNITRTRVESFRTQYNYDPSDQLSFDFVSPGSSTIPDSSLSIPEILKRFVTGGYSGLERGTYYGSDDDNDFSDYHVTEKFGFDLADASDLQSNLQRSYTSFKDSLDTSFPSFNPTPSNKDPQADPNPDDGE